MRIVIEKELDGDYFAAMTDAEIIADLQADGRIWDGSSYVVERDQ